jgi:HSP20 family protein
MTAGSAKFHRSDRRPKPRFRGASAIAPTIATCRFFRGAAFTPGKAAQGGSTHRLDHRRIFARNSSSQSGIEEDSTMATRSLLPFVFGGSPMSRGGGGGGTDPFLTLHREMNRLFDDMFRGYGMPMAGTAAEGGATAMAPRIDVSEDDREIRVSAELPGVTEKDVDVTLQDDILTIRGERKAEQEDRQRNYHVMERSYGSFMRSLRLPFAVQPDQIQASFENGVLTVTIPKAAQQQSAHRIQIRGGAGGTAQGTPQGIDRAAAGDKPTAGPAEAGVGPAGGPQAGGSSGRAGTRTTVE